VLIPESTRKRKGGDDPGPAALDSVTSALPASLRAKLLEARETVLKETRSLVLGRAVMPGYRRFDGNMYRHIPPEAWEDRAAGVEVLIVSGPYGLIGSRDPIPAYEHSMAEPAAPFGKLNRWWHSRSLPEILAGYIDSVGPRTVVDLLSLEYREAVTGYQDRVRDAEVVPIDFPGLGRASQPRRGERVADVLRSGHL